MTRLLYQGVPGQIDNRIWVPQSLPGLSNGARS